MNDPLVLGIGTATTQVSVALGGAGGPLASMTLNLGRRHGELLAPAVQAVTRLAGVSLRQVDLVAVDVGPGLFTGLRVGVATGKALASALGLQMVPCSSLDLLAYPHRVARRPVASVVDARRGEVFWALYTAGEDGMVATVGPVVQAPEQLVAALSRTVSEGGEPVIVAGDGARRYSAQLEHLEGVLLAGPEHDHPSPAALVELGAQRPPVPPEKVLPEYLRGADVRIGWERRDG